MRPRTIVTGSLGLLLALVWAMAFLYQRNNVGFLTAVILADAPLALKLSNVWSVLQIWIMGLLAIPVALTSVGVMFGSQAMIRVLRITAGATAVLSAGILVIYAILSAPRAIAGGSVFLANPRINYELLVAAVALGIQIAVLALHRQTGRSDAGSDVGSLASSRS